MSDVYPLLVYVMLLLVSLPWNINNPRAGISSALCIVISLVPWTATSILWILRKYMNERTNFIWLKEQTDFEEHPAIGLFYQQGQDQFHCQTRWTPLFFSKSNGMKFMGGEMPAPWKQQERTVVRSPRCWEEKRHAGLWDSLFISFPSEVKERPKLTVLSFPKTNPLQGTWQWPWKVLLKASSVREGSFPGAPTRFGSSNSLIKATATLIIILCCEVFPHDYV